jgi:hypothetical protein
VTAPAPGHLRDQTVLHIIAEPSDREHEREQYAPASVDRGAPEALRALHRAMKRSELEPLALEQIDPSGELSHRLADVQDARHALDRLAQLSMRSALARPSLPQFQGP